MPNSSPRPSSARSPGLTELSLEPASEAERGNTLDMPRLRLRREHQAFINGAPVAIGSKSSLARAKSPLGLPTLGHRAPRRTLLRARPRRQRALSRRYSSGALERRPSVHLHDQHSRSTAAFSTSSPKASASPASCRSAQEAPRTNRSRVPSPSEARSLGASNLQPRANARSHSHRPVGVQEIVDRRRNRTAAVNVVDLPVRFHLHRTRHRLGERANRTTSSSPSSRVPRSSINQLFGASLSGIITSVLRVAILILCLLFAIIELLALWMAIRLSRTITTSVADLYSATQHIDRGDLQLPHRRHHATISSPS